MAKVVWRDKALQMLEALLTMRWQSLEERLSAIGTETSSELKHGWRCIQSHTHRSRYWPIEKRRIAERQ